MYSSPPPNRTVLDTRSVSDRTDTSKSAPPTPPLTANVAPPPRDRPKTPIRLHNPALRAAVADHSSMRLDDYPSKRLADLAEGSHTHVDTRVKYAQYQDATKQGSTSGGRARQQMHRPHTPRMGNHRMRQNTGPETAIDVPHLASSSIWRCFPTFAKCKNTYARHRRQTFGRESLKGHRRKKPILPDDIDSKHFAWQRPTQISHSATASPHVG